MAILLYPTTTPFNTLSPIAVFLSPAFRVFKLKLPIATLLAPFFRAHVDSVPMDMLALLTKLFFKARGDSP
jgi:hypothetical protein